MLRLVVVWDEQNQREIELLTNQLAFGSTTIAAIYKDRWEIELFFKTLKQNLKVKTFVGTSENALRIQIWTALIALLLLKWLHHLSKAKWSLSNLASMLRLNLFTYRDLNAWLHEPFGTPPLSYAAVQLTFELTSLGQANSKTSTSTLPQTAQYPRLFNRSHPTPGRFWTAVSRKDWPKDTKSSLSFMNGWISVCSIANVLPSNLLVANISTPPSFRLSAPSFSASAQARSS